MKQNICENCYEPFTLKNPESTAHGFCKACLTKHNESDEDFDLRTYVELTGPLGHKLCPTAPVKKHIF